VVIIDVGSLPIDVGSGCFAVRNSGSRVAAENGEDRGGPP